MQWLFDWAERHPVLSQLTLWGVLFGFFKHLGLDAFYGTINGWIAKQLAKISVIDMDSLIQITSVLTTAIITGVVAVAVFQGGRSYQRASTKAPALPPAPPAVPQTTPKIKPRTPAVSVGPSPLFRRRFSRLGRDRPPKVVKKTINWEQILSTYSGADLERLDEALYKIYEVLSNSGPITSARFLNGNFELKLQSGKTPFLEQINKIDEGLKHIASQLQTIYKEYSYYGKDIQSILGGERSHLRNALHKYKKVIDALPERPDRPLLDLIKDQRKAFTDVADEAARGAADTQKRIKEGRSVIQTLRK